MPGVYAAMEVLVLPSRQEGFEKEQFGRVLAEAMACGVAVVGSDCGAIPEVIGEAGLVYAQGDVAALAACLERLADPTRRAEMAGAGSGAGASYVLVNGLGDGHGGGLGAVER